MNRKALRLVVCLLLLFSPTLSYTAQERPGVEHVVTKVIDGDTVVLDTGEVVRYIGIDAPERGKGAGTSEFYAREATNYNRRLVQMKKVRLEFDVERKDSYGRLLAYVFVKKLFVNAELVRLGYARAAVYPPNTAYKDVLLSHQKEAMEKEAGLWQEKKRDTEPFYVGNKRNYIFHKPDCSFATRMPEKSRITFRSRTDCIKVGYAPCKKCKP